VAGFAAWHAHRAPSAAEPAPAQPASGEQAPPVEPSVSLDGMLAHRPGGRP
jgi:hypothetical protein